MIFKNISIIFAFLTLNVLSSPIEDINTDFNLLNNNTPVEDITTDFNSLNNDTEVSSYASNAVNDSVVEMEISIDELEMANVAELYYEVEMETDNKFGSDSESETDEPNVEFETDFENETDEADEIEMVSEIINDFECLTPECHETSKRILSMMDQTVDPCEDFYKFSCGGWLNENKLPKDVFGISPTLEIEKNNKEIIHQILEGEYPVNNNLSPEDQELDKEIFNRIKTIYNSCMDEEAIRKLGKKPIVDLLNQLDLYNNKSKYEGVDGITNLIIDLHQYGIRFLFKSYVREDLSDHNVNIISIGKPDLVLQKYQYDENGDLNEYKNVIVRTLNQFYEDKKNERNIEEMASKIKDFEKKLSQKILMYEDVKHPRLKELMENCPNINWKKYVESRFINYDVKTKLNEKNELNENIPILNETPSYIDDLSRLLNDIDIDTLIYYAEWCVITNYIQYISEDISRPFNDYVNKNTYGIMGKKERYKTCIEITELLMGNAVGKYFVEKAFDDNITIMVKEIAENIRQIMLNRALNVAWPDLTTSEIVIKKIKNMNFDKIGYPDYILNPKELLKEYEGFEIDPDVFFNTIVNYELFTERKTFKKVEVPADYKGWKELPQTVNAFYNVLDNSITIPAGILQPPFVDPKQPDYINYGAIGNIVGHELIHPFDSFNSIFDGDGLFIIYENWDNTYYYPTVEKYAYCYVKQYRNYSYIPEEKNEKPIPIDEVTTFNENLADNLGLKRSLEAWKLSNNTENSNKRNKALPGLSNFTPEQLYFITFGQTFCEKGTTEMAKYLIATNRHSLGQFRVKGSVSNNEDFAKAFSCPRNSPMNPELKCSFW